MEKVVLSKVYVSRFVLLGGCFTPVYPGFCYVEICHIGRPVISLTLRKVRSISSSVTCMSTFSLTCREVSCSDSEESSHQIRIIHCLKRRPF